MSIQYFKSFLRRSNCCKTWKVVRISVAEIILRSLALSLQGGPSWAKLSQTLWHYHLESDLSQEDGKPKTKSLERMISSSVDSTVVALSGGHPLTLLLLIGIMSGSLQQENLTKLLSRAQMLLMMNSCIRFQSLVLLALVMTSYGLDWSTTHDWIFWSVDFGSLVKMDDSMGATILGSRGNIGSCCDSHKCIYREHRCIIRPSMQTCQYSHHSYL